MKSLKEFEKMKEMNHGTHRIHGMKILTLALLGVLLCGAANAAAVTATTEAFRLSIKHNDTWCPRTAAASEAINYSTAWATNALTDAKAVVKVYPAKREKPKYIAIDLSGGTAATHYPIEYLEDVPDGGWSDEYKTSKLVLRHIPAGSFIMGGRATDYPRQRCGLSCKVWCRLWRIDKRPHASGTFRAFG